jgi:pfkB family carbohydrate kinase
VPKVGVVGSLVWDLIHGRDPLAPPTEEWGGIAYALGGLDASLPPDWEIVPLIKVGRDLAPEAAELLRGLQRLTPGGRGIEVPAPNNRVVLHYQSAERRCERMSGGVPGWTWGELGPMVRDLDAIYLNFISGFELALGTAQALRQGFPGPIYADLHSLFLGMQHDGMRVLQPLADPAAWFACFDVVQLNEDEMRQLSPDPLSLSAQALGAGTSLLVVTLGPKGAAYVAAPGFDGWRVGGRTGGRADGQVVGSFRDLQPNGSSGRLTVRPSDRPTVRTALIPAPQLDAIDPTGCGDVFGAAACARLLAGDGVEQALRQATAMAGRNAMLRGAGGLSRHLRGELLVP